MLGLGTNFLNDTSIYLLYTNIILLIILSLASTDLPVRLYGKFKLKFNKYYILEDIALVLVLIVSIAYLVDMTYNPFLYFRF